MVLAQLAERLLPTTEDPGSNLAISIFRKDENKEKKRSGMASFKIRRNGRRLRCICGIWVVVVS